MAQHVHQIFEETIGQPPDDVSVRNSNQNAGVASVGPMGHRIFDAAGFLEHVGQGKPEGGLHFLRSKLEFLFFDQKEGMRRNDERCARTRVPFDVIEPAKILGIPQLDPYLFEGFAGRREGRRQFLAHAHRL